MKLKIFAVKDRQTDMYATPIFLVSQGQAIRHFSDEVNRANENNPLYHHPDDYDLFELGEFDTNSGLFNTHPALQLALGKQLRINKPGE